MHEQVYSISHHATFYPTFKFKYNVFFAKKLPLHITSVNTYIFLNLNC